MAPAGGWHRALGQVSFSVHCGLVGRVDVGFQRWMFGGLISQLQVLNVGCGWGAARARFLPDVGCRTRGGVDAEFVSPSLPPSVTVWT